MKLQGSREDPGLEVERRELEDQVGGLDRKLSSMNTEEKENENEVRLHSIYTVELCYSVPSRVCIIRVYVLTYKHI